MDAAGKAETVQEELQEMDEEDLDGETLEGLAAGRQTRSTTS
jgi:hypothetical protein